MRSTKPSHLLRGILNPEIGKIESHDECVDRQETGGCGPGRREADQGFPDLRRGAERGAGHGGAFCVRCAAALARDYRLYFPGVRGIWGGGFREGVHGLSRGRGRLEPGGGGRWVHATVWMVWGKLVLESAKTSKIPQINLFSCLKKPRRKAFPQTPEPQTQKLLRTLLCAHSTGLPILPTGITTSSWAIRDTSSTPAACSPRWIAGGRGPCASMRAWATPRSRTNATNICWRMAPPDCRWRLICRRRSGLIRTIRWRRGRWVRSASPLIPSKMWSGCSTGLTSPRFPPR